MNPVPPIEENHDVLVVFALIEKLKKEYNIDEERIYMQGMSCGNAMTTMMARHFGNKFAAMEGSAGPGTMGLMFREDGTPNNDAGPFRYCRQEWKTTEHHLEVQTVHLTL